MEENAVIQHTGVGLALTPKNHMIVVEEVAKKLAEVAHAHGLYKQIGQSKHLRIEGWQLVASLMHVSVKITGTHFLDFGQVHGWEAFAEMIEDATGQTIGRAEGMCLSDEENWGLRPRYDKTEAGRGEKIMAPVPLQQLRSMAQTRAASKVLSNRFKYIAVLGGFAGTPAEEMTGNEHGEQGNGGVAQPQRKSAGGPVISEAQSKRFYAIAKGSGKSDDEIKAFVKQCGFESSKDITRDKYDQMCELVKQPATQHAAGLEKPSAEELAKTASGPQPLPEEKF